MSEEAAVAEVSVGERLQAAHEQLTKLMYQAGTAGLLAKRLGGLNQYADGKEPCRLVRASVQVSLQEGESVHHYGYEMAPSDSADAELDGALLGELIYSLMKAGRACSMTAVVRLQQVAQALAELGALSKEASGAPGAVSQPAELLQFPNPAAESVPAEQMTIAEIAKDIAESAPQAEHADGAIQPIAIQEVAAEPVAASAE